MIYYFYNINNKGKILYTYTYKYLKFFNKFLWLLSIFTTEVIKMKLVTLPKQCNQLHVISNETKKFKN